MKPYIFELESCVVDTTEITFKRPFDMIYKKNWSWCGCGYAVFMLKIWEDDV